MARTIKDMVVVITGASAGIGKALAEQLSARGAKLVLAARRMDRLENLNKSLGGAHLCVAADVSRKDDCHHLIDEAKKRFGRIDTLVCNAGYGLYRTVAQTTPDDTRAIFATNVFGTTDCIDFALPIISEQSERDGWRGQIVIVSSCVARRGVPYIGMYSATKAAQLALAETMRVELRPMRIAVTSVHPVQTQTEFGKVAEELGNSVMPAGAMGQTAEVVAKKMVRTIERPGRELWPSPMARFAFAVNSVAPSLMDFGLSVYRKKVERANLKTVRT
jgi:short-subunit dehydrogenase